MVSFNSIIFLSVKLQDTSSSLELTYSLSLTGINVPPIILVVAL